MANLYFSLPIVQNSVGAGVDISAAGAEKTIVVKGAFTGILTLEISEDGGTTWCPLTSFSAAAKVTIPFAANNIRVRSSGSTTLAPFAPVIDVGANDDGGSFVTITAPAANGTGAAVDISALGLFTTVLVQGDLGNGALAIEISENGVDFVEAMTFMNAGCQSKIMVANYVRAVSRGVRTSALPFSPVCTMGAVNDPSEAAIINFLDSVNPFTKQQYAVPVALTYGANISVDAELSNNFTVTLSGATGQLDNPTNLVAGMTFTFVVTQDGVGGRALTFDTNYDFGSEGAPDLTTSGIGVIDIISAYAISSTKLACTTLRGF
jgi:hypothetical protein